MPLPLRRGDDSTEVADLQRLLNKVGGMLLDEGKFAAQTEDAVKDTQAMAALPVTGVADKALVDWLVAQPEANPVIPTRAVTFIARAEVTDRAAYKTRYQRPIWPGVEAGITIGIGYDLRMQSPAQFDQDWQGLLPPAALDALRPTLGSIGSAALAASLAAITVPLGAAWPNFAGRVMPRYVGNTRNAFGGPAFDALHGLCKGALLSLVYNRGAGMDDKPGEDKRREMRAIRDHIAAGTLDQVEQDFRDMRRLWPGVPGLQKRRDDEADLWRAGLNGG